MPPRELAALFDAHKDGQRMANYRAGLLATLLHNQQRKRGTEPIEPLEWFGDKIEKPVQTAEEIRVNLEAWAAVVSRK